MNINIMFLGKAVSHNLSLNGYNVVAACDTDHDRVKEMPKGIKACSFPREVAELSDVIITGNIFNEAANDIMIYCIISFYNIWLLSFFLIWLC